MKEIKLSHINFKLEIGRELKINVESYSGP